MLLRLRSFVLFLAAFCLLGLLRPAAAATITEYPSGIAGGRPNDITVGPDGNLWFTDFFNGGLGR